MSETTAVAVVEGDEKEGSEEAKLTVSPAPGVSPEPGVYYGVPMAEYNSWNDCVRSSWLSRLLNRNSTPAHVRHAIDNPSGETDALRMGEAIHTAILEP